MVGFGPEDEHFVAELTYNYGVGEYQLGNDFLVSESYIFRDTFNKGQKHVLPCREKKISIVRGYF